MKRKRFKKDRQGLRIERMLQSSVTSGREDEGNRREKERERWGGTTGSEARDLSSRRYSPVWSGIICRYFQIRIWLNRWGTT